MTRPAIVAAHRALALALLVGALTGGPAGAQTCQRAVALRVNEGGLAFLAQQALPLLPKELAVPPLTQTVFDWPFTSEDAQLQLQGLTASLAVSELQATMDNATLLLRLRGDVRASGPVAILHPYPGQAREDCQASLATLGAAVRLGLQLDSSGDAIAVHVTDAKVTLDPSATTATLSGCATGDLLASVAGLLRDHLLGAAQSALEGLARTQLPGLLQDQLRAAGSFAGEVHGLRYQAALASLDTDERGLRLTVSGSVVPQSSVVPPCLAAADLTAPSCAGASPALRATGAMFAAGVSAPLLEQILFALWRSGQLCLDSRSLEAGPLAAALGQLAAALGQPAGTTVAFRLTLARPPRVRCAARSGVTLELPGAALDLSLEPPGGPSGRLALTADLAVSAEPWIDPASNSVAVSLSGTEVSRVDVLGSQGLTLDPARLQRFLSDVVIPALHLRLAALQLSPAVIDSGHSFLVSLRQLEVGDGFLAAYLDAYPGGLAERDTSPPRTLILRDPGPVVGPQLTPIVVGGTDDVTPVPLLRYRARVDGGAWSAPSYSRRLDVATPAGLHLVEVAAVDLHGNVDPEPVQVRLQVDSVPPVLRVLERPTALVRDGRAAVRFEGSDDLTRVVKLVYQAELFRVPDGGGVPDRVGLRAWTAGVSDARFEDLDDGVYRLRLTVRDEAGNVTSDDSGFVVQHEGCQAAPGRATGSLPVVLALLGALALLGRLRRAGDR